MDEYEKEKRTEIFQKIKNIDKICNDFFSAKSPGICPACHTPKYPEVNPNSNVGSISFIYKRDCKCTQDDICKAYYGKTYHELLTEVGM